MDTVTKNINLNVNQPNNYQLIHAMQGNNNTVEITATIWNGNELYSIDADDISLEWQSPSGNKKDYPIKENTTHTITFILQSDMLVENGDYTFCIRFDYDNSDTLRTFCSTMRVSKAPFGQLMESEMITITELVNQTKEYYNKLISEKGQPNGIAILDANAKVPITELYDATTTSKGITQLEDSIISPSTTTAATSNSVKKVNDALNKESIRATNAESNLDSKKVDKTTVAGADLGLIKSGTDITVDSNGNVSVNDNSHEHTVSNISDLTATANELNVLDGITATTTELNYTDGVTSNIQTQLNAKAPLASPTFTGAPIAPTASVGTNTTQIATKAFVQTAVSNGIAASDALIFKGSIGTNGTVTTLPTTYNTGWTYRVVTPGTYAGQVCEIGDLIVALVDRNGSDNVNSDWCVAQTNINGAITGIKSGDAYIDYSQSGSVVTITHKDVTRTNTASTASPSNGGSFTTIDSVTSDAKGHITNVNTKTITLPTFTAENITPGSIGAIPVSVKLWDEDLDDVKTAGFYHSGGGNTVKHKPSGVDYFGLEVIQSALNGWTQILYDNKNVKVYRRRFVDGSWTAWVEEINDIGALPKDGTAVNADMVDSFHASSFLGNGTGYVHPGVNGGDANDYKTEFHGFVFNMSNTPSVNGSNYGFLDVCCFDGSGFTPSRDGVVLQKFTHYSTGYVFIRTYVSGSWTAWKQLSTSDHSHSYNDLSNRWILRSATISINAGTSISGGFYGSGGSVTVGTYSELVVLSISSSNIMGFMYNWSYSGTTLSMSMAKIGSGTNTVTIYYLTR